MKYQPIRVFLVILLGALAMPTVSFAQQFEGSTVTGLSWSPDGQYLAIRTFRGEIELVDSLTGESQVIPGQDAFRIAAFAWSPDGSRLVLGSYDQRIKIWNIFGDEVFLELQGLSAFTGITWTPDGEHIITGSDSQSPSLQIWDFTTGALLFSKDEGATGLLSWSPDGNLLAVSGISEIIIRNPETYDVVRRIGLESDFDLQYHITIAQWLPDNQRLAVGYANGKLRIWNVITGLVEMELTASEREQRAGDFLSMSSVLDLTITADGTMISALSRDGTFRTWELDSQTVTETYQFADPLIAAEYSPFFGRVAYSTLNSASRLRSPEDSSVHAALNEGNLYIVIPDPSLDRLADIQAACVADAQGVTTLPAPESTPQQDAIAAVESLAAQDVTSLTIDALPAYIAQVEALPEGSIPPACAADLIAVAEAVMAAGSAGSE
jgi:WD40 repeat protein